MADVEFAVGFLFLDAAQYMYTGSTQDSLRVGNVWQTIYCADKYNLPMLMDMCLQFIRSQLKDDNCLAYLENVKLFAHGCVAAFVEKCLETVDASTTAILQSKQFLAIRQDTLVMLLQRNSLSAEENTIYTAVEKYTGFTWSAEACRKNNLEPSDDNRRQMLGAALFLVRFPLLTDSELVNGPAKSGLLLDSELLAIYKYKNAVTKPPLVFPADYRTGCGFAGFRFKERSASLSHRFLEFHHSLLSRNMWIISIWPSGRD
ncbi:BTB/POZ domain-containing protein 2-like [Paramacrobiotus metropolitanus]|uniref:BTB/POZ domain-containing protein 2-like n=1 Tax=Paramacrobiotus metropolitanus TaxID=2943436 RepID=UPI0024456F6E|nr:BTB/POZ domain-containing protein 2-like [Paramacrobiotus metropolitanus]